MRLSLWPSVFIVLLVAGNTSADTTSSSGSSSGTSSTTSTSSTSSSRISSRSSGSSSRPSGTSKSSSRSTSRSSATPTPSSEPPIPGVYPLASPDSPPPVDQPALVPDFGPAWADAYTAAKDRISNYTLEQKVGITTGVGHLNGRCDGNIPAVADFTGLCLEGSSVGVRNTDFVTVFPAPINAAATWQRSLLRSRGAAMGKEHFGKGVNIALNPMMNLGRIPQGGRNWEGFGADPFLAGVSAYETILGIQSSGVQAVAGHYINYEQEAQRESYSSNVDDRTQHEIYAAPFLRSVMAGVASVMCSYNLVNGVHACENNVTLNNILKGEFGFQGFVMSDWYATQSTNSALNGLDMTMPGDTTPGSSGSYFGASLIAAVQSGTIPEARVDDMATRILAAWYFLGQKNFTTQPNFNANNLFDDTKNARVNVQADHGTLVQQIGAASLVLLKNVDGFLPLKKPRRIVLIGSDAAPARVAGPNGFTDQGGVDGVLAMGWGSGTARLTYLISPYEALQSRARNDHTSFSWFFNDFDTAGASAAAVHQDAAIVFLQASSGEETITVDGNVGDRNNLTAWHNGDALVQAVANTTSTIVVVHSVGPIILEPWIDNPNVKAIIWAGLGGTETGNALAEVLYGDVNPSGRLPYTIARSQSDYPSQLTTGTQIDYAEGLFIDYRHFDAEHIEPRYEFGFGLSYTTFEYSALSVTAVTGQQDQDGSLEANWAASQPIPPVVGGSTALWLHRPLFEVTLNVKNTGGVAGTEIPQLYVHFPANSGEPPSVLRGFTDVNLQPGQMQTVSIPLSRYDLSVWDVSNQSWMRPAGPYNISVGASSRDLRLRTQLPF